MLEDAMTKRDAPRAAAPLRRLRVEVVAGSDAGAVCEADGDEALSIGTAEGNALRLGDRKVSRYHLELTREGEGATVQDLGSLNGTWAGNLRVQRATVYPGATIRVGDTVLSVQDGSVAPTRDVHGVEPIAGMIAVSPKTLRVVHDVRQLADTNASVLIHGETGTGKELVARALHDLSRRRQRPFEVVDCGSMAATLVASELFGHERGAFTGADRRRLGAFERANGGTVFLDEIGELPLAVQPALLGVLERRRFRRVGGDEEIRVDVRLVSATHRDLRQSVNDGSFRADLYYRVAVAKIHVPPLRERPDDVPSLVAHFVRELTGESGHDTFAPEVMKSLTQHRWSGNVRELRNVVESALAMGAVRLEGDEPAATAGALAADAAAIADGPPAPYRDARARALERFERAYLDALVRQCGSNASEAARQAQMDRNYLVSLLRKHGLR